MLRSSELAAEAERRSKAVLESQEMQLQADLRAKQANLAVASVNIGYTKVYAPGDGTVGERTSSARTTCLSRHAGDLVRCSHKMGAGELPRNAVDQREGRRPCRTSH